MINFSIMKRINLTILIPLFLILASCGQKNKDKEIAESKTISKINKDSLVNAVFEHGHQYFNIQNKDSIIGRFGKPINSYKTQWCGGLCDDSLLTSFEYPDYTFKFFEKGNSKIELESIYTFDQKTSFPASLTIGKTTRKDILERLGLPDADNNDPGRSMTKSGDTTAYGTQAGSGDTVTFAYYIKIDEYAINLSMTKDTLRKISWIKNMN